MLAIDRLLNMPVRDTKHIYDENLAILYAASVGCGLSRLDPDHLKFVFEESLVAMPSMVDILARETDSWMHDPANGIDTVKVVHSENGFEIHKTVPIAAEIVGRTRIIEIIDKGAAKGALLKFEREISDAGSGDLLATVAGTIFLRGNGGFSAEPMRSPPPHPVPDRPADLTTELPTSPQAAIIYRLTGDMNPLHVDPAFASAAGFPSPILHGSCLFGVACHAAVKMVCGYDPTRLRSFHARFSSPFYPGETLETRIWLEGPGEFSFQCVARERNVVVLDHGKGSFA